ncbi:MAG: cytochrome [Gammaproteobacteria bacterium]|nr:cytochrome [Gammaproteobacteria bacterium]
MTWSPFDSKVMEDPGMGHEYLLEQCPVHLYQSSELEFYTLSRYSDLESSLRDIEVFSSHHGQGPNFSEPAGMLCDPPQHTIYRRLIQPAFSPKSIEALRPKVIKLTNQLVDDIFSGDGDFDLHDQLAFPLPVIIIAGMLGVPISDLEKFKLWSDIQVEVMGSGDPEKYREEQQSFQDYMVTHLRKRKKEIEIGEKVDQDLLTLIAAAKTPDNESIPESDALSMLNQLLVGGNETTTSLITNLVWRLLEEPSRWKMLLDDRSLIGSAIEESLRFDPPVLGLYRNSTAAVSLHDQVIPEGKKVYMYYAAANRDPDVFENPNVFDICRRPRKHMSFGLGTHFCVGAPTARLEAEVALEVLLERMPRLSLLGSGERIKPFFLWGRRKLPCKWR